MLSKILIASMVSTAAAVTSSAYTTTDCSYVIFSTFLFNIPLFMQMNTFYSPCRSILSIICPTDLPPTHAPPPPPSIPFSPLQTVVANP